MATNRPLYLIFSLSAILGSNGNADGHRDVAPSFEQVAKKYGTDKVTTHKYQFMYDKYLSGIRDKRLKLLEIGLGCNMDYGPGASYYTWLEYLPNVDLYFIEYDRQCAEKYQDKTANAHVFIGDQADPVFLAEFSTAATVNGLFDVIIDDGGHTMNQQITSLESLWPIVKPGGLYIIEDLQTSFWDTFGGDPSTKNPSKHTAMKYLYQILDDMMVGKNTKPMSRDMRSVDCMSEICALRKKEEGSV
ncbi:8-demethyl-8-alpha-L-rhamnosyl tetracenomycin-C 2'-O-methyltransferase-like protein [Cladobotryum mycophilum]|uniref:8-demethyl-8-alpha-L-rhamnosyl tetracenomycin-C 2'-O-methyltransferase-like protein n=1 Tax=Cladobotryum mycophilum TaxID=491253 RepID=A0ABR0SLP1_9HYPO